MSASVLISEIFTGELMIRDDEFSEILINGKFPDILEIFKFSKNNDRIVPNYQKLI